MAPKNLGDLPIDPLAKRNSNISKVTQLHTFPSAERDLLISVECYRCIRIPKKARSVESGPQLTNYIALRSEL
jgi:hypothetical protein